MAKQSVLGKYHPKIQKKVACPMMKLTDQAHSILQGREIKHTQLIKISNN
jgi:hypothetical protein